MRIITAVSLAAVITIASSARAGLHYSGETLAELPSQWRGFLVDLRSLRVLGFPQAPGLPPSPLRTEYREALARLEKKANPNADELADLGALYVRTGQAAKAVELLRAAQRKQPDHFRIAANLGTAWHLQGDLDQATDCLRIAVKLAPVRLRPAEELHLKLVQFRKKDLKAVDRLDDLFGVRFVGEKGEWEPGKIAEAERKKLPPDAAATIQRLALSLPADARLLWQLAELANAIGDIRTAASIFDG